MVDVKISRLDADFFYPALRQLAEMALYKQENVFLFRISSRKDHIFISSGSNSSYDFDMYFLYILDFFLYSHLSFMGCIQFEIRKKIGLLNCEGKPRV